MACFRLEPDGSPIPSRETFSFVVSSGFSSILGMIVRYLRCGIGIGVNEDESPPRFSFDTQPMYYNINT